MHPLGFQYRAPYIPPPLPPEPTSHLESLIERFIATQSKTNETLSESINQMNPKFDTMASQQKAMDTQIAQQVSHYLDSRGTYQVRPRPTLEDMSMLSL